MSITAWRIVKAKYLAMAFDGEGARLFGGRWNSPGTRMVYTSDSPAAAVLEMLVHLDANGVLKHYYLIPVTFDEALTQVLDLKILPANWNRRQAPASVQRIGDQWVKSTVSALLRVPSVVAPGGYSYLINPAHPDAAALKIGTPERYRFDRRLK